MKIGIIRYPGSNCDIDTFNYFGNCFYIWYKETKLPSLDLLIIPGGFAFGDRYYDTATADYTINPGKMAIEAPVTNIIQEAATQKIPILGICNGFQILLQLKLLPGELIKNNTNTFTCKRVNCLVNFHSEIVDYNESINMWVANSYGNYQCDLSCNEELKNNNQIFLKYENFDNGSLDSIAGISNKEQNIFGMMPHPERNSSFKELLLKILFHKQSSIKKK